MEFNWCLQHGSVVFHPGQKSLPARLHCRYLPHNSRCIMVIYLPQLFCFIDQSTNFSICRLWEQCNDCRFKSHKAIQPFSPWNLLGKQDPFHRTMRSITINLPLTFWLSRCTNNYIYFVEHASVIKLKINQLQTKTFSPVKTSPHIQAHSPGLFCSTLQKVPSFKHNKDKVPWCVPPPRNLVAVL